MIIRRILKGIAISIAILIGGTVAWFFIDLSPTFHKYFGTPQAQYEFRLNDRVFETMDPEMAKLHKKLGRDLTQTEVNKVWDEVEAKIRAEDIRKNRGPAGGSK